MDFGFVFFGSVHIHPAVALAEKRGFTHAWLYDSQMLASDVYASLALCAEHTKRIFLGPGVTNPASRIAPMTASAIASINALAPGRTILGIGTGNTARRTLGMPAARLDVLREHIRVCRDLLAGKTTPYQEGERRRMIRFLNPKSGAIDIKKKIPIYVAASGAKSLELAGEIADGVILFGAVTPSLIDFHMSHVRAGAERVGRDHKKIYKLCMTAFHQTKPEERLESPRVRRAVGPFVSSSSNLIAFSSPNPTDLPADLRDDLVAFKNAYREAGRTNRDATSEAVRRLSPRLQERARTLGDRENDPRHHADRNARRNHRIDSRDEEGGYSSGRRASGHRFERNHRDIFE